MEGLILGILRYTVLCFVKKSTWLFEIDYARMTFTNNIF